MKDDFEILRTGDFVWEFCTGGTVPEGKLVDSFELNLISFSFHRSCSMRTDCGWGKIVCGSMLIFRNANAWKGPSIAWLLM